MPERRPSRPRPHAAGTPPADPSPPSKTRLKKDMQALQSLGEELLELPEARLAEVDLPAPLRTALAEARRIRSHEGRRRQLQYVGKLMRGVDPQPLREALDAFRLPAARDTLALHQAEQWRERLLADDGALADFVAGHPGVDVTRLRSLVRQARSDAAASPPARDGAATRHSRAYRELFRLVRECAAPEPADQASPDPSPHAADDDPSLP